MSFRYKSRDKSVLENLNYKIPKGSHIGIIGETGSGKSTVLDILMGLLTPSTGQLVVDDTPIYENNKKNWQSIIGHVPQNIYLTSLNYDTGLKSSIGDKNIIIEALKGKDIKNIKENNLISINGRDNFVKFRQFY